MPKPALNYGSTGSKAISRPRRSLPMAKSMFAARRGKSPCSPPGGSLSCWPKTISRMASWLRRLRLAMRSLFEPRRTSTASRIKFVAELRARVSPGSRENLNPFHRSELLSDGGIVRSSSMYLVRWKRFSWDLSKAAPSGAAALHSFQIRLADREDERALREVIFNAFALDFGWGEVVKAIRAQL